MKKNLICILITILLIVISGGCIPDFSRKPSDDTKKKIMYYQKTVISLINNKDASGIRNLFAATALTEIDDLDIGIDYIFSLFKKKIANGNIDYEDSYDGGLHATDDVDAEGNAIWVEDAKISFYFLYQGDKYLVSMYIVTHDEYHPEEQGVWEIVITKANNAIYCDWNFIVCWFGQDGIYHPGRNRSIIKTGEDYFAKEEQERDIESEKDMKERFEAEKEKLREEEKL